MSSGRTSIELRELLRIGAPLMAAYLAEYAMFVITRSQAGQLGYESLAAVGIAGDLTFELLVVGMGALSVVGVILAQAFGSGDRQAVGHAARQGLVVAGAAGIFCTMLVWCLPWVLPYLGQEPVVVDLATPYLWALSGCVLPTLLFTILRSFVTAVGRTSSVMVITVAMVGVHYFLTRGLVHGMYGLPAMGTAGAGWSMTISTWLMLIFLALHTWRTPEFRGFGLFLGRFRMDYPICWDILRMGLPAGLLVGLESGLFAAVSVLSGVLGAKALAAHQIVLSWVGLPFVIALGLAEGAMIRVALGIGRGDPVAARRSGIVCIGAAVGILSLLIYVPLAHGQFLVDFFIQPDQVGASDVSDLAIKLLVIVALFQVFDGLQAVAARALRGLRDTVAPLWIAGFGYWVVGIGGGCFLAFGLDWGAAGLWWGLAGGLIVTGTLLVVRFLTLTRHLIRNKRASAPN
jgi:multidrug resistance protein, MATE family